MEFHCSLIDSSPSPDRLKPQSEPSNPRDSNDESSEVVKVENVEAEDDTDLVRSIMDGRESEREEMETLYTTLTSVTPAPGDDTASVFSLYQLRPAPTPDPDPGYSSPSSHTHYYSLSPPDLLSPPLSTSDPCMSPGDSMSLSSSSVSPPHHNLSSHHDPGHLFPLSLASSYETPPGQSESEIIPIQSMTPADNPESIIEKTKSIKQEPQDKQKDESISFLSRNPGTNQGMSRQETCLDCSHKICSCSKQSKVKQLFNPTTQTQQLSSDDASQDKNSRKLMAKLCGKNSEQPMKGETEEMWRVDSNTATDAICTRGGNEAKPEVRSSTRGQPSTCPLPADIPTLESLALSSPKLSTWRQTRIISEKLEQHLWTWRCACKKSGKRISKSLLQARAKWAFRKAGIVEFKVIHVLQLLMWDI